MDYTGSEATILSGRQEAGQDGIRKRGIMPASLLRRTLWASGFAALLLALASLAVLFVASNRIVNDRIALELEALTGFDVAIGTTPEIEIWPKLRATLSDVTLSAGGEEVLAADHVELELSALAALGGDASFSKAKLIRPSLRVEQTASGRYAPLLPDRGRIAATVSAARAAVAEAGEDEAEADLPDEPFGSIEFVDGRIVAPSPDGESELATDVSGTLSWPELDGSGSLSATGIWRGEELALDVNSPTPMLLLGGGVAPLTVSLKSAPANFSFEGSADFARNEFFDGQAKFSTPSLRRVLEWSDREMAGSSAIGSVSISSRVTGNAQRLTFEDAAMDVDGNPGSGVLDVSLTGRRPLITGTLDFETIDLLSVLTAFTPLEAGPGGDPAEINLSFASRIDVDLRLSAAKAALGSVTLNRIAATAHLTDGLAAFDVTDAAAFGGSVQASIRFDTKPETAQVELRLLASEIKGDAFAAAVGWKRLAPTGSGKISVILKGAGNGWDAILGSADGSVSGSFGSGTLSGFDLGLFLERIATGGFFPLGEAAGTPMPVTRAELKAQVSDGVATIDKAEAMSDRYRLLLSGVATYAGRGLALSGSIEPAGETVPAAGAPSPDFFVGGTWNAPFISPVGAGGR